MRIIATVSFLFLGEEGKHVRARALEISEVPEWVKETTTFRDGYHAGLIKVMTNSDQTQKVEKVQEDLKGTARQQSEQLTEGVKSDEQVKAEAVKTQAQAIKKIAKKKVTTKK